MPTHQLTFTFQNCMATFCKLKVNKGTLFDLRLRLSIFYTPLVVEMTSFDCNKKDPFNSQPSPIVSMLVLAQNIYINPSASNRLETDRHAVLYHIFAHEFI